MKDILAHMIYLADKWLPIVWYVALLVVTALLWYVACTNTTTVGLFCFLGALPCTLVLLVVTGILVYVLWEETTSWADARLLTKRQEQYRRDRAMANAIRERMQ